MKTLFTTFYLLLLALLVQSNQEEIVRSTTFRTPKNVAFATIGGGRNHHMWVFEILKEMNERGHNVSFYSRVRKNFYESYAAF